MHALWIVFWLELTLFCLEGKYHSIKIEIREALKRSLSVYIYIYINWKKNEMNSWINDKQNVLKMTMQDWTYKNYDENLQNEK